MRSVVAWLALKYTKPFSCLCDWADRSGIHIHFYPSSNYDRYLCCSAEAVATGEVNELVTLGYFYTSCRGFAMGDVYGKQPWLVRMVKCGYANIFFMLQVMLSHCHCADC